MKRELRRDAKKIRLLVRNGHGLRIIAAYYGVSMLAVARVVYGCPRST